MAVMTIQIHRRADLTPGAFQAHWRDVHGPLVRELSAALGITRYAQILPDLDAQADWDGLALVWFESRADFARLAATESGRAAARRLRADEHQFTDVARATTIWGEAREVI